LLSASENFRFDLKRPRPYCGVTGLRPTYGLVSRYGRDGAFLGPWTRLGPMCRSAEDCGLVLENHRQAVIREIPARPARVFYYTPQYLPQTERDADRLRAGGLHRPCAPCGAGLAFEQALAVNSRKPARKLVEMRLSGSTITGLSPAPSFLAEGASVFRTDDYKAARWMSLADPKQNRGSEVWSR